LETRTLIDKMVDNINNQGGFITPPNIIKNAIFYYASGLIGFADITVNNNFIRYFGATFAPSGIGKTFVNDEIKKMFGINDEKIERLFFQNIEPMEFNNGKNDIVEFCPSFTNPLKGSEEGLYLVCLASTKLKVGCLNLIADEVLDSITTNFKYFLSLKEIYDGELDGKFIKGDSVMNKKIRGIKCNTLIFGVSNKLKIPNIHTKVLDLYESGFYRRTFTVVTMPQKTTKRVGNLLKNGELEEISYALETFKEITRTLYLNKFGYEQGKKGISEDETFLNMELTNLAKAEYDKISDECFEFQNEHYEDLKYSTESSAPKKILQLSAIIALLNGNTLVKAEHLQEAYSFHKECRNDIKKLFNYQTKFLMIYNALKIKSLTKTEMMKEFDIQTAEGLEAELNLVREHCQLQKTLFKTSNKRGLPQVATYSIQ